MSLLSADRPWLPRYRTIISSMLPAGFEREHPMPFNEIAQKVVGGNAAANPETISALNGLAVVRATWYWIGSLPPSLPCTQGGGGRGEGPSGLLSKETATNPHDLPLTPTLSPEYGGEGVRIVDRLVRGQFEDGHLLATTADDHPESVWYFELQLTHALATAGLLLKKDIFLSSAIRAATYILREIQPDHATNRPWGLPAFLLSESTLPLADWILHASTVHLTTTTDEMTLLLLADCLYCFAR